MTHEHRWHRDGISGRWACAGCWADGGDREQPRAPGVLCVNCGETDPEYVSDQCCSRCGHQTAELDQGGYFCGSNYCDDPACEGDRPERL